MTDNTPLPAYIRCQAEGCEKEREILLHAANDANGASLMTDVCWEHAAGAYDYFSDLILNCDCPFCERACEQLGRRSPDVG